MADNLNINNSISVQDQVNFVKFSYLLSESSPQIQKKLNIVLGKNALTLRTVQNLDMEI